MKTSNPYIESLLSDGKIQQILNEQEKAYWNAALENVSDETVKPSLSLAKLTFIFTTFSFENLHEKEVAELSYRLLKSFPISDETLRVEFNGLANIEVEDQYLPYYFIIASIALQLEKTISARLALTDYKEIKNGDSRWDRRVLSSILRALLYLIRKKNGYKDIRKAINEISLLQEEQKTFEADYLNTFASNQQTEEALWLLSLYHTSKAVVETAEYILKGYEYSNRRIDAIVRQHMDVAKKLTSIESEKRVLSIIESDLYALINHCIWTGTAWHEKIKALCK